MPRKKVPQATIETAMTIINIETFNNLIYNLVEHNATFLERLKIQNSPEGFSCMASTLQKMSELLVVASGRTHTLVVSLPKENELLMSEEILTQTTPKH